MDDQEITRLLLDEMKGLRKDLVDRLASHDDRIRKNEKDVNTIEVRFVEHEKNQTFHTRILVGMISSTFFIAVRDIMARIAKHI